MTESIDKAKKPSFRANDFGFSSEGKHSRTTYLQMETSSTDRNWTGYN